MQVCFRIYKSGEFWDIFSTSTKFYRFGHTKCSWVQLGIWFDVVAVDQCVLIYTFVLKTLMKVFKVDNLYKCSSDSNITFRLNMNLFINLFSFSDNKNLGIIISLVSKMFSSILFI